MGKKFKKILSLTVLIFFVFGFVSSVPVNAGPCEDGRDACFFDALLIGILTGYIAGLVYADLCLLGYSWCKKYYLL